jgi:hypothetical protein
MKVTYQQRLKQQLWFWRAGKILLAGGVASLSVAFMLALIQSPAHVTLFFTVGFFGVGSGTLSITLLTHLGWSRFALFDFILNQLSLGLVLGGLAMAVFGIMLQLYGIAVWGVLTMWMAIALIGLGISRFHSPISPEGQPIEDSAEWSIQDFLAGKHFRKSVVGATVGLTYGLLLGLPGRVLFLIPVGAFVGALVGIDKGTNRISTDLIRVLQDTIRVGIIGTIIVTVFCTLLLGLLLGGTVAAFGTGAAVGALIGGVGGAIVGSVGSKRQRS